MSASSTGETSVAQAYNEYCRTNRFDARMFLKKAARSGDAEQDSKAAACFSSTLRCLALLSQLPPEEAHLTADYLETKLTKHNYRGGGNRLPATVKRMSQVPVDFKVALLQKACPELGLDTALVKALDAADHRTIKELFNFIFCLSDDTGVPEEMLRRIIMERVLIKRRKAVGRPSQWWLENVWKLAVDGSKIIDWTLGGVYSFVKSPTSHTFMVRHISMVDAPVPDGLSIHDGLQIENNMVDMKAAILVGKNRIFIKDWFPKKVGPNSPLVLNQKLCCFTEDIPKFMKQVAAEEARTQSVGVSSEAANLASELKANEAARRAEALAKRAAPAPSTKRRRTLVVPSVASAAPAALQSLAHAPKSDDPSSAISPAEGVGET